MSETLEPMATEVDQKPVAEQLLAQAKEQGVELVGHTNSSFAPQIVN
jgi:putative transposase